MWIVRDSVPRRFPQIELPMMWEQDSIAAQSFLPAAKETTLNVCRPLLEGATYHNIRARIKCSEPGLNITKENVSNILDYPPPLGSGGGLGFLWCSRHRSLIAGVEGAPGAWGLQPERRKRPQVINVANHLVSLQWKPLTLCDIDNLTQSSKNRRNVLSLFVNAKPTWGEVKEGKEGRVSVEP
jgi:hypothetical protein